MKIEAFGDTQKADFARRSYIKFVVADPKQGERVAVIGLVSDRHLKLQHINLLPEEAALVGGGDIKQDLDSGAVTSKWGSTSCEDKKGYDRPEDERTAETILAEVRDSFIEWLHST